MKPEQILEPRGRIVVGTDGSQSSAAAVRWALEAAEQTGAWLDVVLVWSAVIDFGWLGAAPVHGWRSQPSEQGHALVETLVSEVCGRPLPPLVRTFVMEGDPAQCLLDHAAGADVLVLGDRGAGGFLGLRLGSTASACAAHSSCPVLIVPSRRGTGTLGLLPSRTDVPALRSNPPARVATGVLR